MIDYDRLGQVMTDCDRLDRQMDGWMDRQIDRFIDQIDQIDQIRFDSIGLDQIRLDR